MKCDLPGLYVQPRNGIKGLRDGALLYNVLHSFFFKYTNIFIDQFNSIKTGLQS